LALVVALSRGQIFEKGERNFLLSPGEIAAEFSDIVSTKTLALSQIILLTKRSMCERKSF
jgi:hypothetical protein